jgi:PhnB protein
VANRKLNAYLNFNGDCAEALKFYEKVLGAKVEFSSTFGATPMADSVPSEDRNRVMHATLVIDGQTLMASDVLSAMPPAKMSGFALSLNFDTAEEAGRVFAALSEGGQVTMPIEKTFWAEAFGMLVDRFGVPWMVNCQTQPE